VTIAPDDELQARMRERYALLVRMMGQDREMAYGWKSSVSDALGAPKSLITRVSQGNLRHVGAEAVLRAIVRVRVHPDFFIHPQTPGNIWFMDNERGYEP
jgi:hypothetical protein